MSISQEQQAGAFEVQASIFGPPCVVQEYKGRAVFVPDGFTAAQIWGAAKMLEREFDVVPYTSQHMAVAVLVTAKIALSEKVVQTFLKTPPRQHKEDVGKGPKKRSSQTGAPGKGKAKQKQREVR